MKIQNRQEIYIYTDGIWISGKDGLFNKSYRENCIYLKKIKLKKN